MSVEKLEKQIDDLMDKRDKLEEKCDTLPECEKDDGCETCKVFAEIEKLDEEIEKLEEKLDELIGSDDED
ncbi:MAG: hypothetical protein JXA99_14645 [Candidatus Lokiarchaeota archaeon]|nr:hypothetical protein [Candidatus Lokiarchaeota archaeon]